MREDITILVAEDDKGHFVLTKHCLRRSGVSNEIVWLEDGQETLDFLAAADCRKEYVLLLDIRMPKIDGINVLARIKADDRLKHIPVIMLTTSNAPANIATCKQLGCDGYIVKPVDKTLAGAIEQACGAAR